MSAILEFSIIPLDKETTISHYVARTLKLIRESGLPYEVCPMSGCVEGEWDELMALVTRCFKDIARESHHIHVDIRVNWRSGHVSRISSTPAV
jgi:uncharacterized protein (TIGR00106 family)